MIYIKDKMNYVNNDTGFLTANEFNSMKNELANIVKYRNVLADNDDNQILKAIVMESKTLFYTDSGTVNEIILNRANEVDFLLDNDQVFMFNPAYTNTGTVTIKVGNNLEKRLLLEGNELPIGFLDTTVSYIATYKKDINAFEIKNLTIGKTSDFVFSNLHNEATFIEVNDTELGIGLYNNAVVYIDQNTGKYELAIIENPKSQKQNAIAIYKELNGSKYVFFGGIVPDFLTNLKNGLKYYLSDSTAGAISNNQENKTVLIGRYIKNGKFKLDIEGDVSIDVNELTYKVFDTTSINGETKEGVIFTDASGLFTLMYDKLTFDASALKTTMYANINGSVFKIEFAPEYLNKTFNISYNNVRYNGKFIKATNIADSVDLYLVGNTVVDTETPLLSSINKTFITRVGTPLTLETVTASDNINGDITVVVNGTVDFNLAGTYPVTYTATDGSNNTNSITHTYVVESLPTVVTYGVNIKNPETSNGITFTDPTNNMTLMFNNITYDQTTPAAIMFIKVNNVIAKIDYAVEYLGKTFEVEVAGIRYIGTFAENENYSNPTIINVK